jgi:hypothetical protein
LSPSTTYHFRVRSKDASGNLAVSGDFTFTTGDVGQLPSGVLGYWQFNESSGVSASDSSGNGNTGTLTNGPTFVAGRDSGNALNFDGVNDQVRITRNTGLEPAKVSLSAWIKLAPGVTQQDWATIIKKTYDNDNSEPYGTYSLQLSPAGQGNYLTFHTGHAGGGNELVSPSPIPTGQWVHVAATYDPGTGEKRLYVNGMLVASATLTAPLVYDTTSAGNLYIGQDPGAGEAFRGAIDDVGVWGRALTAAEVQTLAYNGADTTGPTITSVSSSSVTNSGATISWSTDEASDTQVQYGMTTGYGSTTTLNPSRVTSHSATLTGLAAGTTYHYRVLSRDAAGNLAVSGDFTFTVMDGDPPVDPGSTGLANGIAYDASGTMYMAYFDDATQNLKFATRTAAGDWSTVQGVDAGLNVGTYLSLALDSAGRPGIAYLDGTNADLKYAHFNGTSWDVEVVDSKYTTGYYPSLHFGAGDRPVISYYYKTGGDLRLAVSGADGWTITTVDDRGDVGRYSTLALSPLTGRWAVGYEDTSHGTFRYAEQTKRGWGLATVDGSTKIGGGYISLAFSPLTGRPAMSYYDAYNADLKFAAFNGSKWVAQTVASRGTVGLYSNLRIRPDTGDADILYYNKGADGVFRAQVSSATWALTQVASDGGRWLTSAVAPTGVWTASWLSSTGITWLDL